MMRSMFAGVSGLKVHQFRMDVIGNNIANVNTAGYKSSRATFQEMLSQTMRAATAPTETRGGTNPQQVGLGVQLGSIDVKHTQGNTQSTGYITDLAIEGDGFFVLGHGENRVYTRAGMFGLDNGTEGNLVSLVNGQRVLGYKADQDGNIDPNSALEPLYISASETIAPKATDKVYFAGNLDNRYSVGDFVKRTVQIYDSSGREQTLALTLTKDDDHVWAWDAAWLLASDSIKMDNGQIVNNGEYLIEGSNMYAAEDFDDQGNLKATAQPVATTTDGRIWEIAGTAPDVQTFRFDRALVNGTATDRIKLTASSVNGGLQLTAEFSLTDGTGGRSVVNPQDRKIRFNSDGSFLGLSGTGTEHILNLDPVNAEALKVELDFTQFTEYADAFTGKFLSQNGYTSGALESYAIDQNGVIVGSFSNGLTRALGQVALARFANPGGLQRSGSTMFVETANSGTAQIGAPGTPGYGQIAPSSLEMSNVDLSEEFTDMIITQRGFQANSRIITTSDEMLQELVNLKR